MKDLSKLVYIQWDRGLLMLLLDFRSMACYIFSTTIRSYALLAVSQTNRQADRQTGKLIWLLLLFSLLASGGSVSLIRSDEVRWNGIVSYLYIAASCLLLLFETMHFVIGKMRCLMLNTQSLINGAAESPTFAYTLEGFIIISFAWNVLFS